MTFSSTAPPSSAFLRLCRYLVPWRGSLLLGLFAVLISTVLTVVSPWLLKTVVDGLTKGIDRGKLAVYVSLVAGTALVDGWIRYEMRRMLFTMGREVESDIRRDLFAHLTRLPPSYFRSSRTGALVARISDDAAAVRTMLAQGIMHFASYALGIAIAVAAMLWLDRRLTLVALIPLVLAWPVSRRLGRATRDHFVARRTHLTELSAIIQEGLTSIKLLKVSRKESADFARFARVNDSCAQSNERLIVIQSASYATLRLSFFLSTVLVLWFGGYDVIAGRMTLGQFVAFSRFMMLLGWPVTAFGWVVALLRSGMISWERILDLLNVSAGADVPQAAVERPIAGQSVEARCLAFRHADAGGNVFDDVSFKVSRGEVLAIVGAMGSGKSTLAGLLCGLYPAPRGMLFLDGIDMAELPLRSLRRAVSVVTDDPFIFGETVSGNIAFGLGEQLTDTLPRARIERAAELAHFSDDIANFAEGYDTKVGERGVTLSGGQRQRLALARALIRESGILVLDDAISAVDAGTETRILASLRTEAQSRACIVMAHRISTVRDAGQILVLHGGRVVERGSHTRLLAIGGIYADMYRRQSIERDLARL